MEKHRNVRKTLRSYLVKRINTTIRTGDCVLMGSPDPNIPQYVAKILRIVSYGNNVKVHVMWYYRPEETKVGRLEFHGVNEVFSSDHYDSQSADLIEGKCTVHNFRSYTRRDVVDNKDFYSRFKYFPITGEFDPTCIAVYCKCEMPYNPDVLMIGCETCTEWFHPSCIGMTVAEAKQSEHFTCQKCLAADLNKLTR